MDALAYVRRERIARSQRWQAVFYNHSHCMLQTGGEKNSAIKHAATGAHINRTCDSNAFEIVM